MENSKKGAMPMHSILKAIGIISIVFLVYIGLLTLNLSFFDVDMTVVSTKFVFLNSLSYAGGIVIMFFIVKWSIFSLNDIGFCRPQNTRNGLYFGAIVGALMFYLLLLYWDVGLRRDTTENFIMASILFTAVVGFSEEMLFRGLVFNYLLKFGVYKAIFFSSLLFGIMHLLGGISGVNSILGTTLQIVNAFLFGLATASLVSVTKSLWPVILWHFVMNLLSILFEFSFATVGGWAFIMINIVFNIVFSLWIHPQVKRLYTKESVVTSL